MNQSNMKSNKSKHLLKVGLMLEELRENEHLQLYHEVHLTLVKHGSGYYYIFAGVGVTAFGASIMGDAEIYIYKYGSAQVKGRHNASNNYQYWLTPTVQGIIQLDADDYIEIYAQGDVTTSTPLYFYQSAYSWFGGYKLID